MASACVNNIGISPESFSPATYPSYGWLSPRISLSRDKTDSKPPPPDPTPVDSPAEDPTEPPLDPADFEFRPDEFPSAMLSADKLFSDGKLVPLQFSSSTAKPSVPYQTSHGDDLGAPRALALKSHRRNELAGVSVACNDPYLFSPKAPRCSSRWRELLGLKKLSTTPSSNPNPKIAGESHKTAPSLLSNAPSKSLKNFLHRSSKSFSSSSSSSSDSSSLVLPLLLTKESSDSFESVSISSSRLSLSSSSSGHDHDELPRHSLDFPETKPSISLHRNPNNPHPRIIRTSKPRTAMQPPDLSQNARPSRSPLRTRASSDSAASRGVSVDSPRMNSSGKIVFQSLERSSSSPSSFNGGPRFKYRGIERSYSGNVRVITPVLNVPVCSLRVGFGQLFSSPQKRSDASIASSRAHCTARNRTERY